jgi:hypothetical protein
MDTAWIQIFILSLTECVAPQGKTVCQEREIEIEFLSQAQCEAAKEQMVSLKEQSQSVIIDPSKARCAATARKHAVFATLSDVEAASRDLAGWTKPEVSEPETGPIRASHVERLGTLPECEQTGGEAPCKIGDIIIEAGSAGDSRPVEIWRRDN